MGQLDPTSNMFMGSRHFGIFRLRIYGIGTIVSAALVTFQVLDVSGHLSLFFSFVVCFSHRRSAQIKKLLAITA